MTRTRGKILVIRGGAIGDFILTLPVFSALRQQFPETHLEVLGYPHIARLAHAGGLVERVESIESRAVAGYFARGGDLDPQWADYFSSFGVIVSFLYDPDEIFKTNVGRSSPAQFISGPHRPDERRGIHATECLLQPLERLAIFGADPIPRLRVTPERPEGRPGNWLALHPGSGAERKNWPEARWAELLQKIVEDTLWNILLIGGEAEGDRLRRLAGLVPSTRLRPLQSRPLVEVAEALDDCSFFLGHDSGISHLAAAVGLAGLVLWGETDHHVWRPRSDRMETLRATSGLDRLVADEVFRHLPPAGRHP